MSNDASIEAKRKEIAENTTQNLTIFAMNGTIFYATDNAGMVKTSTDDGRTWNDALSYSQLPAGYTIFDVNDSTGSTTLWAVNMTNNSYQYYDGSTSTWSDSGWANTPSALPTAGAVKYHQASDNTNHLIVYDSEAKTATDYNCSPGGQTSQITLPALPTGFTHSFIRYSGGTLTLFAY